MHRISLRMHTAGRMHSIGLADYWKNSSVVRIYISLRGQGHGVIIDALDVVF